MKTFTKFSLAAVAVLGLSSEAYAATIVQSGTTGSTTMVQTGTDDALTVTATAGTFVSDDLTVGGTIYGDNNPYNSLNLNTSLWDVTLQAEDDLFLNADSAGGTYGGVVLQKDGTTLARFDDNIYGNGSTIYTDTYVATGGTYGMPNTAALGLESGTGAGIGYWDADGDLHGFGVDATTAIMSGGTNSSVLTLTDGDTGGATLTVGGSNPLLDPTAIDQTVFSATSDDLGYNSVVTVGSALSDSTTIVQGGGADLTLGGTDAVLSADNDIILNTNNNGLSYGGVVINDVGWGTTVMDIRSNEQGGTNIYSTIDMNGNQITGVAPGTVGTDAVNMNQLNGIENDMSKGIAATTALANIPQVDQGKTYSLGIGYGHYNGENALAIGGSWRYNTDGIMKVSVGTGGSGATVGVGTAMSW